MVIAFEGLWGVGKTTLSKKLAKEFGAIYVPEPDHQISDPNNSKLDEWYKDEFFKILNIHNKKNLLFIDRSLASWAAFMTTRDGCLKKGWNQDYPIIDLILINTSNPEQINRITNSKDKKFPKIDLLKNNPEFAYDVEKNIILYSKMISVNQALVSTHNREIQEKIAAKAIKINIQDSYKKLVSPPGCSGGVIPPSFGHFRPY